MIQIVSVTQSIAASVQITNGVRKRRDLLTASEVDAFEKVRLMNEGCFEER